jgi:hypothetical protein
MAHLNINIVELKINFNGIYYYFETTATPDRVYLTDFNNRLYIDRFLMSQGKERNPKNLKGTKIISFKIKENEKE